MPHYTATRARFASGAVTAVAHGARADDWCWHPTLSVHATSSLRLPGAWETTARREAQRYLHARTLVRRGPAVDGPRVFRKPWTTPAGHTHPMERSVQAASCDASHAGGGAYAVSDMVAGAAPLEPHTLGCGRAG